MIMIHRTFFRLSDSRMSLTASFLFEFEIIFDVPKCVTQIRMKDAKSVDLCMVFDRMRYIYSEIYVKILHSVIQMCCMAVKVDKSQVTLMIVRQNKKKCPLIFHTLTDTFR